MVLGRNGTERALRDEVATTPHAVLPERSIIVVNPDALEECHTLQPAGQFLLLHECPDESEMVRQVFERPPDVPAVDVRQPLTDRINALMISFYKAS